MNTRYRTQGYSTTFTENEYGAFLTIRRNGVLVGEVAVGAFAGGPQPPVQIEIKRFQPNELRHVTQVDEFDDS